MDVLEAIKGRRSIRMFKNDKVPTRLIEMLVDAAQQAPSAGNVQPWEFIIIHEPKTKKELVHAALDQMFMAEAPVVIVVCANEELAAKRYGIRGRTLYCIQDTAAAMQNILLAAYSLGLGTCWVGAFDEEGVREILGISQDVRPVAIVPVGYPAESPSPRTRRPSSQLVHHERFNELKN
jgi:nitroreductase